MANTEDSGLEQAIEQANSITRMVSALNVDYDRLEELEDERGDLAYSVSLAGQDPSEREYAIMDLRKWDAGYSEELAELTGNAGEYTSQDEARDAILEDPLEVTVRSGWVSPYGSLGAEEFCILLCTGGPAVRIRGDLDDNMIPSRAWIEYQHWGTSWTQAFDVIDRDTLLTYCREIFPGE